MGRNDLAASPSLSVMTPSPSRTGDVGAIQRRRRQAPLEQVSSRAPRLDRAAGDEAYLPAAVAIIETPPGRFQTFVACGVCALLAVAIGASFFVQLSVTAVASGKIQAVGQTKVVQPVETGVVSAIRVHEGDRVRAGSILVELDATAATASRATIAQNLAIQRARISRRRAEISASQAETVVIDPPVSWDEDISDDIRQRESSMSHADLSKLAASLDALKAERDVKLASSKSFLARIDAEKNLISVTSERAGIHENLAGQGIESRVQVLEALEPLRAQQAVLATLQGDWAEAEAAVSVLDTELAKVRESFVAEQTRAIAESEEQKDELSQELKKADRSVSSLSLRAPIDGIVHASTVTTVGQTLSKGQQAMQIVPESAAIEVVAYVLNSDIGFVREGQLAQVKIDTFPYSRYGTVRGVVSRVASDAITGADALRDQKNPSIPATGGIDSNTLAAQQTSDLVFPVTISLDLYTIEVAGATTRLTPGMTVVAEIGTAKQSVIEYILYPLSRAVPSAR
jgi:hemolysin D